MLDIPLELFYEPERSGPFSRLIKEPCDLSAEEKNKQSSKSEL